MELDDLRAEVARLDAVVAPIAEAPIDVSDPDWVSKLDHDLPDAELRAVLAELLEKYATADGGTREAIRALLASHRSFRWAAGAPAEPDTEAGFRACLLYWSARDQGSDTRDELLALHGYCQAATRAGVAIGPVLAQVAALSSDEDKYGMGSARALLLRCVPG